MASGALSPLPRVVLLRLTERFTCGEDLVQKKSQTREKSLIWYGVLTVINLDINRAQNRQCRVDLK